MTAYRMRDGIVIKTEDATASWSEATHNGTNISRATCSEFHHETLYRSKKGRYYIETKSEWAPDRHTQKAEWISNKEAWRWLILCGHEIPEELAALAEQVQE